MSLFLAPNFPTSRPLSISFASDYETSTSRPISMRTTSGNSTYSAAAMPSTTPTQPVRPTSSFSKRTTSSRSISSFFRNSDALSTHSSSGRSLYSDLSFSDRMAVTANVAAGARPSATPMNSRPVSYAASSAAPSTFSTKSKRRSSAFAQLSLKQRMAVIAGIAVRA